MVFVRTQKKNDRRGAMAVEAALILPLLLMLTLGAIKYGWLFLKAQQITNATRHGARLAILPDSTTEDVENAIIDILSDGNISINAGNITITPADVSSSAIGDAIEVRVTILTADIDIMNVSLLPTFTNMGASVTMAKEGF